MLNIHVRTAAQRSVVSKGQGRGHLVFRRLSISYADLLAGRLLQSVPFLENRPVEVQILIPIRMVRELRQL